MVSSKSERRNVAIGTYPCQYRVYRKLLSSLVCLPSTICRKVAHDWVQVRLLLMRGANASSTIDPLAMISCMIRQSLYWLNPRFWSDGIQSWSVSVPSANARRMDDSTRSVETAAAERVRQRKSALHKSATPKEQINALPRALLGNFNLALPYNLIKVPCFGTPGHCWRSYRSAITQPRKCQTQDAIKISPIELDKV